MTGDSVTQWADYDAGDYSELFLDFAMLPTDGSTDDRKKILDFAQRRGLLEPSLSDELGGDLEFVAPLLSWNAEILSVRRTLRLLDLIGRSDPKPLRAAIEWREQGVFFVDRETGDEVLIESFGSLVYRQLGQPRTKPAAVWAVTKWINIGLKERTSIGVVPESAGSLPFDLSMSSLGVAGAAWAQIALRSSRSAGPRRCENCGAWFLAQRRTRKFCDKGRCRQQAHEKRRARK
jgi:hypothetical protein